MIITNIKDTKIQSNAIENLPYNHTLASLAKEKRKNGILSEVLFWNVVKSKQFYQLDFDRQRVIGDYILDFYVRTLGLVIEIDGESHTYIGEKDVKRNDFLEKLGLKVYRIEDIEIKSNLQKVLHELEEYIILEFGVKD